LTKLLRWTLKKTIEQHTNLSYGITEKDGQTEAQFVHLKKINWDDMVDFRTSNSISGEDETLSGQLGIAHQQLWKDQYRKPAWKFNVLRHSNETLDREMRVDVTYINHHALGDGTSLAAFHKTFFEYLLQTSSECNPEAGWPHVVPSTIPKPIFVEDALPFPSISETKHQRSEPPVENGPPVPWTATQPSLPSIDSFVSRVEFITILASQLQNILSTCHRLKTTLTGLLHSLIIISLSRSVPGAHGFRATTPYSMRRFTNLSDDEIANHISSITTSWHERLLISARAIRENSPQEEELISEISKQFQTEVSAELAQVPKHGSPALIEISRIRSFDAFCQEAMRGRRGYTYGLSNIGAVKMPGRDGFGVRIEVPLLSE
jgi:hypothetical protein